MKDPELLEKAQQELKGRIDELDKEEHLDLLKELADVISSTYKMQEINEIGKYLTQSQQLVFINIGKANENLEFLSERE